LPEPTGPTMAQVSPSRTDHVRLWKATAPPRRPTVASFRKNMHEPPGVGCWSLSVRPVPLQFGPNNGRDGARFPAALFVLLTKDGRDLAAGQFRLPLEDVEPVVQRRPADFFKRHHNGQLVAETDRPKILARRRYARAADLLAVQIHSHAQAARTQKGMFGRLH